MRECAEQRFQSHSLQGHGHSGSLFTCTGFLSAQNLIIMKIFGPRCEKTCLREFANNTGADQPAHPCSLISAFVIHLVESIISILVSSEISIF